MIGPSSKTERDDARQRARQTERERERERQTEKKKERYVYRHTHTYKMYTHVLGREGEREMKNQSL